MSELKFTVPTEMIDLPSKGKLYEKDNILSSGQVEMKYMTAKEEDILTNINLLKQGKAIQTLLKSIVKTPINHDDLLLGDRNALLLAARILAYGKDYTFAMKNPFTDEEEEVTVDLQKIQYKNVDFSRFNGKNEFSFVLPHTKNEVTFKILTVADDQKIDAEIDGIKKATGVDAGVRSTRLKHQITSVNGDYSSKTIRDFVDSGALLARDSVELKKEMGRLTPDIDTKVSITLSNGETILTELPMGAQFFFPNLN